MTFRLEAILRRGSIEESRHRFQCAVSTPAGALLGSTEHPDLVTTFRSAAKPFQLIPLVERGHADRWGFSPEELAIMSASHTGSAYHLSLVRGILERIGLTPDQLACGTHDPSDPEALLQLQARPSSRSPLYNNCSGKHAGMLALCLSEGWPIAGYERADHPLQQLMRRTIAEMCDRDPESLPVAIDGCSVSVFGLPLSGMALAYARLASATADGTPREQALDRIRRAMTSWPVAVEGRERFSTALMVQGNGRIVAKGGAEGLQCVGDVERGLGIALKCEDGAGRAVGPATLAVLEQLAVLGPDVLRALGEHRRIKVTNVAGLEVGTIDAVLTPGVVA